MAQNKPEAKNDDKTAATDTASTSAATPAKSALQAGREKRAAEMSVANKKEGASADGDTSTGGKKAAEKKPAFVADEKLRDELRGLSDEELIARAQKEATLRAVDVSNVDVFKPTGNTQDGLNGQDVARSGIRSEVLNFLDSRKGKSAPANVIVAYMTLASGKVFKGKFDYGYLTSKDPEAAKRGMVARKLLTVTRVAPPAPEAEAPAA